MNIDDMKVGDLKKLMAMLSGQNDDIDAFEIGQVYVIRTVTMINVGRIVAVGRQEILLEEAAWVADTGRYHDFLKDPEKFAKEVEPYPDGSRPGVGRGAIVDFCKLPQSLRSQK